MKAIELEAALAGGGLNSIVALAAADLDGDDCDEVLVGRGGASQIEVYRLCALGGGMTPQYVFEPLSPVTLDNGAKLRYRNASIVVLDLDADQDPKHNLDVVVNATDCQVHAAFGDGTGAFSSTENGAQMTSALSPDGDEEMYRGLIDTDGVIMAADIRTDRPGPELMHVGCPPGDPFVSDLCAPVARGCEALAADLDGDGLADIVTTQGQQVGLVVGRASTTGGFHFGALDTECPPHDLAVGDFDDDGINDVAFLDQAATASGATTAVKIAYGRPSANPEQPRVAGLLDRAMGLVSGRFTRVAMSDVTAPTKLFAARNLGAGDNVSSAIGMLGGNNERQTLAPFYLPETSAGDANRLADMEIFATAEGKFVLGDDGLPARAMAVIARESGQPMELWLVRHDSADGTLVAVRSEGVTDLACALPEESSAPPGGCVLASANADGDGLDELLLFQDKKLIVLSAGKTGFTELSRAPTTHTFLSIDGVKLPGRYNPRPLVTDLDGSNASVFLRDSEGVIVAFWGNGDGTFEEIELFESGTCSGKCAVARIREGVGAKKRIVLAGPGVLGVYEMSARKPVLLTDVDLPVPTPKKDTDFVAVAARDFDGDGVDDVAIMPSSSSIHVFRGIPVHE